MNLLIDLLVLQKLILHTIRFGCVPAGLQTVTQSTLGRTGQMLCRTYINDLNSEKRQMVLAWFWYRFFLHSWISPKNSTSRRDSVFIISLLL